MPVSGSDTLRPADAFSATYGAVPESPLAIYELRPSALEKMKEFLLRGERRKAYHYALDEKLWAHALLLAKDLDQDSWKEAVQEFIRAELTFPPRDASSASNGQESLRILYSLISGQGGSSGRCGLEKFGRKGPLFNFLVGWIPYVSGATSGLMVRVWVVNLCKY